MRARPLTKTVNILFVVACGVALAIFLISGFNRGLFAEAGFMPHGHCYLWSPALIWTMFTTDILIGLAYVSISLCLYVLVRRIRLPFSSMFLAFGLFIAACGTTHFMEVLTLWHPTYWIAAFVKVVTALASVATAAIMFPLFPRVVEFATSARLSEERKKQLEVLNQELEIKTNALTIANRELEAFSYSVSHDLRSPLRGISGFSQILAEDYAPALDAKGKEYLEYVRTGAQRMGQIIDDLLNLSKMTRVDMNLGNVNLSELATEILHDFQTEDPERKVSIAVQSEILVNGDAGLLRIVLENLLSNAWKFSSQTVGARVEFGAQNECGRRTFFVRDNGVGFDMQYAKKLFHPFQRLHSNEEYSGTGIGLTTAKRIIDRHGGTIRVESLPGQGTTIYFTLGLT